MKTITLNIEDDAHKELTSIVNFKMMNDQDYEPDCQFIFFILYAIYKDSPSITIAKELLERKMRKMIPKKDEKKSADK